MSETLSTFLSLKGILSSILGATVFGTLVILGKYSLKTFKKFQKFSKTPFTVNTEEDRFIIHLELESIKSYISSFEYFSVLLLILGVFGYLLLSNELEFALEYNREIGIKTDLKMYAIFSILLLALFCMWTSRVLSKKYLLLLDNLRTRLSNFSTDKL